MAIQGTVTYKSRGRRNFYKDWKILLSNAHILFKDVYGQKTNANTVF
jgi:hypothetical protein